MNNFKLIRINYKYCNYLRMFDNKVPYNEGIKELRPFIGVLIKTEVVNILHHCLVPKQNI